MQVRPGPVARNRWSSKPNPPTLVQGRVLLLLALRLGWAVPVATAAAADRKGPARTEPTANSQEGTAASPPASGTTVATPRVGELGELGRLSFVGARSFSVEALRLGLAGTTDFGEVSHPLAPRADYLKALERKLSVGYQHLGFPEVRVEAQPDLATGLVRVRVEEGPRFRCGAIKVSGVQGALARAIVRRLRAPPASSTDPTQSFSFADRAPDTAVVDETAPKKPSDTEAPWVKDQPAPLSDYDRQRLKWEVTDVLADWGWFFPEVEVAIAREAATRRARLGVQVRTLGPRRLVNQIECVGNKKDSREALLRYLELRPGMELTRAGATRLADRLWQAARFRDFHITVSAADAAPKVDVRVALAEYPPAPPLAQEFSPLERALLQARAWLAGLHRRREDIVIEVLGYPTTATGVELLLSPRGEVALVETAPRGAASRPGPGGLVVKAGRVELFAPARGRKLVLACPGAQFQAFINATGSAAANDERQFDLQIGAGFGADDEAGRIPTSLAVSLPPVLFVDLAHATGAVARLDCGRLVYSNADLVLRTETRTGRILEFSETFTTGLTAGVRVEFERGRCRRETKLAERAGARLTDAFRPEAPLSSSLAFLTEAALRSDLLPPLLGTNVAAATWAHLPGLLDALRLPEALRPLEQVRGAYPNPPRGEEEFVVPEPPADQNDYLAAVVSLLLPLADKLLPDGSWAWTLVHESALVARGRTAYTAPTLEGFYRSAATGPLGYWAAAGLLAWAHEPALAGLFRTRGLQRLAAADFRRDCTMLLDRQSVLGQCLWNLALGLRDLPEADRQGLATSLPPFVAQFLQDAGRALRQAPGPPDRETLTPALDALWDHGLRGRVAAALHTPAPDHP